MKRRGRPPYPAILTPRQQEALALLREGLTNPQIAERLGISLDGAKFLVGEVISRLGVADRAEAARWQPAAAAPAPTGRFAWALAPVTLLRKITPAWLPPAASGAAIVAVLAGVGVLAWAVVSTGSGGTRVVAPTAPPGAAPVARTGIATLDATIDRLVRRDITGLLDLAQFEDIGCSVEQTVGSPPPCPTGVADGTPVQAFPLGFCEGTYVTTIDQLSQVFGLALLRQPSAAVYAVLRDNSQDRTQDNYWIAVTQDRPSQATAGVSLWNVTPDGHIVSLQNECGPVGAAQQVAYRFPVNPDFLLGPFINCSPPPGQTPNFMVTVEGLSPGGVLPQFWGDAKSTLGEDTGERAIVSVRPETNWIGDIDRLEDVRPGMELEAVGVRQPDCTIVAQTILTPAPNSLHSDALGIELQYPFNWHEGATPMPYASCMGCTTLGPKDVPYPYGVSIFTFPKAPPPGDSAGSYCTIRCLDAGIGPRNLKVAGVDASQVEMLRQPSVGVTNETGETALYHEIWTMVPRSGDALLVVWFYRDGDAVGEGYVRRSMETMLKSLVLLPPP